MKIDSLSTHSIVTLEKWLDALATMHIRVWWLLQWVAIIHLSSVKNFVRIQIFLMWDQWPLPLCDLRCKWGGPILRYWLQSLYILLLHMTSCRKAFKGHDRVEVIWGHWLHRLYHQSSMVATVSGKKVPFKCQKLLKNTLSWGRFNSHCSLCNFRRQKRYWSAESIYPCETIFIRHTQE